MRTFTDNMEYEYINGQYYSEEKVREGTVRWVDGMLCRSKNETLLLDGEEYDVITRTFKKKREVVCWIEII